MRQRLYRLWGILPLPAVLRWMLVWLATPKFLVGAVGVILNDDGQVLLLKHTYRGQYPWGLPGGWLEPKEAPAAAIRREIHEETGLRVRVVGPLLIENSDLVRRLDLIYLCELESGTFRASPEVVAARYFSADSLPAMHISQRAVIRRAMRAAGSF